MNFKEMVADDLGEVFFNIEEQGTEMVHRLDNNEPETLVVIFDIKSEIKLDHEVVGHQPSILVTQEVEAKIKNRSVLIIEGIEYNKSHTDDENVDLIRIFLERA